MPALSLLTWMRPHRDLRSIAEDGEAAKAGVQIGDRITAISHRAGQLLTDRSNKAAIEKVLVSDPGEISVTVMRKRSILQPSVGDAFVVSSGLTREKRQSSYQSSTRSDTSSPVDKGHSRRPRGGESPTSWYESQHEQAFGPAPAVTAGPARDDTCGLETSHKEPIVPAKPSLPLAQIMNNMEAPNSARDKSSRKLSARSPLASATDEAKMAKQTLAAADEGGVSGFLGWIAEVTNRTDLSNRNVDWSPASVRV